MKRFICVAAVLAVFIAVPAVLTAMSHSSGAEGEKMSDQKVDMEAAKETFEATCSQCHSLSRPLGKKKDRNGWESTVSRMSSYHERRFDQPISEADQEAIIQYLLSEAGK